jgi:hypothetical protein
MIEYKLISKILYTYGELYNRTITKELIDIYYNALKDLSEKEFRQAAKEVLNENKFFPLPADLRQKTFQLIEKQEKLLSASDALEEIEKQIREVGSYGKPVFTHEIIEKSVSAIGGWYHLCVEANLDVVRGQFLRIYENMCNRYKTDKRLLPETKLLINNQRRQLQSKSRLTDKNQFGDFVKELTEKFSETQ